MHIPRIYVLSHYILGFISWKFSNIIPIFVIYQIVQFCYNTRFFILELDINTLNFDKCFKKGNSIAHTYIKLEQYTIGFCIALFFKLLLYYLNQMFLFDFLREHNIHN